VRRRAAKAGLRELGTSRTEHYLGVGDAPKSFREEALHLCERILDSFQTYFQAKGFPVKAPSRRMIVVVLADKRSYVAYKGELALEAEAGFYSIEADELAIFDSRGAAGVAVDDARWVNTFTLVHEAVHQLTFDTGMLDRAADVPVAVSEGLATYSELWQPRTPKIGQFNRLRVRVLGEPGTEWLPLEKLLTDDRVFADAATVQMAYAESWLLVHQLLRTTGGATKLRTYLNILRTRRDAAHRADDAARALGKLSNLDRELKRTARNVLGVM
jgi:hypothetical protein